MGRPPKKRKVEGDVYEALLPSQLDIISEVEKEWASAEIMPDIIDLCPRVYLSGLNGGLNNQHVGSATLFGSTDSLKPIAATVDTWPDFSTTSASASMLSLSPGFVNMPQNLNQGTLQDTPSCPCLSYLYLCLSTLSSLNSFSITRETLTSLCTAARTAQDVIRCEICPLSFATGMQNVMMLGTLLSVMADAWLKISQTDAETLGRELSSPDFQELINKDDPHEACVTWLFWLRQVVRRAVIGGHIHPDICPTNPTNARTPDLFSLVREMEERQRKWHATGISHNLDIFPAQGQTNPSCSPINTPSTSSCLSSNTPSDSTSQSNLNSLGEGLSPDSTTKQHLHERKFLCMQVVGTAKEVIRKFGFSPSEYPEGVEPLKEK